MFILLTVCIKFYIIHSCASDFFGRDDNDYMITLIQDSSPGNEIINYKLRHEFSIKCNAFYKIHFADACCPDTLSSWTAFDKNSNLIYLNVNDYYFNNNGVYNTNETIIYAGDLNVQSKHGPVCAMDINAPNETVAVCNETYVETNHVKLVSKSITAMNNGALYRYIMDINIAKDNMGNYYVPPTKTLCVGAAENRDLNIVLVCGRYDYHRSGINIVRPFKPEIFRQLKLVWDEYDCKETTIEKYRHILFAIVTPVPLDIEYELNIPTVIYEPPYLAENRKMMPNSVLLSELQMLKYPYLEFLQQKNLRRVAIVSDNSLYSIKFEEELTAMFKEKNIMFTIKRCETGCDKFFKSVSGSLNEDRVSIAIANFDQKYNGVCNGYKGIWLIRDWQDSGRPLILPRNSYVIKMDPVKPKLKIRESIKIIQAAHFDTRDLNDVTREHFYKKVAESMVKARDSATHVFHVVKDPDEYMTVEVTQQGVHTTQFKSHMDISDVQTCIFRSNNYHRSCDDEIFLMIMLVVTVFITTLMLISIYFQKSSPVHAARYQNFR